MDASSIGVAVGAALLFILDSTWTRRRLKKNTAPISNGAIPTVQATLYRIEAKQDDQAQKLAYLTGRVDEHIQATQVPRKGRAS